MKTCPHCAEEVQDLAKRCRHCQASLVPKRLSKHYAIVAIATLLGVALVGYLNSDYRSKRLIMAVVNNTLTDDDVEMRKILASRDPEDLLKLTFDSEKERNKRISMLKDVCPNDKNSVRDATLDLFRCENTLIEQKGTICIGQAMVKDKFTSAVRDAGENDKSVAYQKVVNFCRQTDKACEDFYAAQKEAIDKEGSLRAILPMRSNIIFESLTANIDWAKWIQNDVASYEKQAAEAVQVYSAHR